MAAAPERSARATLRLDVEYDGGGFRGWAAQPGLRTVQGELSGALETVLRRPVELTVAGRTDAGVHAIGQVVSLPHSGPIPESLVRSVNGLLPDDVAVTAVGTMPEGWSARHDARSRSYRYRVLVRDAPSPFERGRALWWPHGLDRAALDACAAATVGSHDFTAFTPTETDHVRFTREVLAARWVGGPGADILSFEVEADAFMRHMVRVLVGTMLEVAGGRRSADDFAALLRGAPRGRAGETAPPDGLYLVGVTYPD